jgi:hypothetical protein
MDIHPASAFLCRSVCIGLSRIETRDVVLHVHAIGGCVGAGVHRFALGEGLHRNLVEDEKADSGSGTSMGVRDCENVEERLLGGNGDFE